jgi:hypothetical protein
MRLYGRLEPYQGSEHDCAALSKPTKLVHLPFEADVSQKKGCASGQSKPERFQINASTPAPSWYRTKLGRYVTD